MLAYNRYGFILEWMASRTRRWRGVGRSVIHLGLNRMAGVLQATFSIALQGNVIFWLELYWFFPMLPFMAWHFTPDNQLYELYTHSYTIIVVNKIDIYRVWYHFSHACVTNAGIHYSLRIWLWRHHQNRYRANETRGMMCIKIIITWLCGFWREITSVLP